MADKKDQRFTFDSDAEGQEVPTLTSLLYQKKAVKTGSSGRQTPPSKMTLDPTTTIERPLPSELSGTGVSFTEPKGTPPAVVRSTLGSGGAAKALGALKGEPRMRRTLPAIAPYIQGPVIKPVGADLYPSTAFAAAGLRSMIQKPRVNAALVFESRDPDTYRMAAILQSSGASSRTQLWNGMEFSTQGFSDLWGRLGKFGFAEFSTLGAAGSGNFDRLAFRAAFQAKSSEWVTLVRVKETSGTEGLVVFLSEASIQSLLPSFHSEILGASDTIALAA